jgi:hypothetical protein
MTYLGINLMGETKDLFNEYYKHWTEKWKKTSEDRKTFPACGLVETTLWKWPYYWKQSTCLMQPLFWSLEYNILQVLHFYAFIIISPEKGIVCSHTFLQHFIVCRHLSVHNLLYVWCSTQNISSFHSHKF